MSEENDSKITDLEAKLTKALESIEKLESKNKELAAEKQQAKTAEQAALDAAQTAAEEKALASTSVEEVRASLEAKHKRDLQKLTDQLTETAQTRDKLLIDSAIASDLNALNVAPQFRAILTQAFKAQAAVKGEEALINGVPLSEHIKDFFGGDEGKHYVAAPVNTGAGLTGNVGGATQITKMPKTASEWTAFHQLEKSDPALYNHLSTEFGLSKD